MPQILHGLAVQTEILTRLKPRIHKLSRPPVLAVVLVGQDPASEIYVRTKIKACAELGIFSEQVSPPETATTEELVAAIEELNGRPDIDGILVQMPSISGRPLSSSIAATSSSVVAVSGGLTCSLKMPSSAQALIFVRT